MLWLESLALTPQPQRSRPPSHLPMGCIRVVCESLSGGNGWVPKPNKNRTWIWTWVWLRALIPHWPCCFPNKMMSHLRRKRPSHPQRKEALSWSPSKCDGAGADEVIDIALSPSLHRRACLLHPFHVICEKLVLKSWGGSLEGEWSLAFYRGTEWQISPSGTRRPEVLLNSQCLEPWGWARLLEGVFESSSH